MATRRKERELLPSYIPPMLAKPGQPFDSPDYLFEIKWDGTRCLCFVDGRTSTGYRLVNRRRIDMTDRYPEFAFLGDLPEGTLLDGEMIVFKDGKPDFGLLQTREQAQSPLKIRTKARTLPATYVVFDILFDKGRSVMDRPFLERRQILEKLVAKVHNAKLVLSRGIAGHGRAFFQKAAAEGLEGIIAKRQRSPYLPGKRTNAWIKIKRSQELYCVVIGFEPSGKNDFRSLILARDLAGKLSCVGKVGTGFDNALRDRLNAWLWSHLQDKPVIKNKHKGKWVEPRLVCRVSCMELTSGGEMRAPAFQELVRE